MLEIREGLYLLSPEIACQKVKEREENSHSLYRLQRLGKKMEIKKKIIRRTSYFNLLNY